MQISVHSAQKMSLRRPVARTARTKAASSQALMLVRSTGGWSPSSSASGGTVGLPRPDLTLTVECTIGRRNTRASFTVETMFLTRRSRSMDRVEREPRAVPTDLRLQLHEVIFVDLPAEPE